MVLEYKMRYCHHDPRKEIQDPGNPGKRPEACNFIKEETLTQVFSCEFCEIFKNTFFTEHLWATASERDQNISKT